MVVDATHPIFSAIMAHHSKEPMSICNHQIPYQTQKYWGDSEISIEKCGCGERDTRMAT